MSKSTTTFTNDFLYNFFRLDRKLRELKLRFNSGRVSQIEFDRVSWELFLEHGITEDEYESANNVLSIDG